MMTMDKKPSMDTESFAGDTFFIKLASRSPVRKGDGNVPSAVPEEDMEVMHTVVLPHSAAVVEEEREISIKDIVADLPLKPRDRYKFIRSIGFGGMKTVLLVRDNDTGRNVAMAMLPDSSSQTAGKVRRFIQEAHITARLEHPNIVAVHDIGVSMFSQSREIQQEPKWKPAP